MKKNIRKSRRVTHAEIPNNEMNKWGYPQAPIRRGHDGWKPPCNIVKAGWAWRGHVPYEGVKQSVYRWVPVCEGCDNPRCVAKAEEEE
jgi:hypothetical protein